jgi:hypothetical protein
MDRVRFGRALGYGARHAAKSLAKAADAAASPNPRAAAGAAGTARARAESRGGFAATGAAARAKGPGGAAPQAGTRRTGGATGGGDGRVAQAKAGVRQGKTRAGELRRHVWSPLAKFSGVVGLQVSGTFFALVALFLSKGLWRTRGAVHLGLASPEAEKLYLHAAAFAIFVYFAVSSFVRAYLKERR